MNSLLILKEIELAVSRLSPEELASFRERFDEFKEQTMELKKYIYWQDEDMWLGYLEEYPDYMTQGKTIEELEENLRDIYKELSGGNIPCVRKVAELEVVHCEILMYVLSIATLTPVFFTSAVAGQFTPKKEGGNAQEDFIAYETIAKLIGLPF